MRTLRTLSQKERQINTQYTDSSLIKTRAGIWCRITQICKRRGLSGASGFSMMEIMLVLVIISILTTISMPALRGFAASRRLRTAAQKIVDTFTFARDMAITERHTHLVVFDLTGNRYWLASSETFNTQNPMASAGRTANTPTTNNQQVPVSRTGGVMGVPQSLTEGISIPSMVTTFGGTTQEVTTGAGFVYFTPTSTSQDTVIYLQNLREQVVAITVEGVTGRASIQDMSAEQLQAAGIRN